MSGAWLTRKFARAESPVSPSFLRQFKTKDVGARDLSQKALDVVFRPFVPLAARLDDDEEEVHEDDRDAVDEDELDDAEKREVAGRIVALVRLSLHWTGWGDAR